MAQGINGAKSGYYDFTYLMNLDLTGSYNDSTNGYIFDFGFNICEGLQITYGEIFPNETAGWFFGTLNSFEISNGGGPNFIQTYTNGDRGYPCTSGRKTQFNIYCNECPVANSCNNSNSNCVCSGFYTLNDDETSDVCLATINVSIHNCPPFVSYPSIMNINLLNKQNNKLTGSQIFGIILLVFFILLSVGCVGGYAYNYKVYDRRGKEAIPGYLFY